VGSLRRLWRGAPNPCQRRALGRFPLRTQGATPTPLDRVVVPGGSVAGLLAAAALSDSFESVTLVERDELPLDGPDTRHPRRGVPHGFQVHHMLSLGNERIDELLPGLDAELVREGGEHRDPVCDFGQFIDDQWVLHVRSGLQITCFQRPLLEWVIRRRVLARYNVVVRRGVGRGLVASPDGRRVVGVTVGDSPGDRILGGTPRGRAWDHEHQRHGRRRDPPLRRGPAHRDAERRDARLPARDLDGFMRYFEGSPPPCSPRSCGGGRW